MDPANIPQTLSMFSDEQLWTVVHQQFTWSEDVRLRELTDLGKQGKLSVEEEGEMEHLIDQVDQYSLRRSQALLLLNQRGYDVERRLRLNSNANGDTR